MNISELIKTDIYKLLEECQSDLDVIPQVIALLEELYLRRQEDEEKILQAQYILDKITISSTAQDIASLCMLAVEDDY
ncbi:MAG: hypothetical protein KDJ65_30185 [Anaerolineae bacterium]|nr:hypothetical protein [Anaerolineae bacterium]